MALKRPNKLQYAMYDPRGKAKYKADLAKYYEAKREAEAKKNKLSTEKNIKKQKTANKKAATTTKTTKGTTTTKPKSTAAKGKSLATGKTTSKTKAVETPQTTTATKTRTKTRTQTKSKTTTKTTPKSKTVTKPATKSKTTSRTTGKSGKSLKIKDRYVRKPQYTKENYGKPKQKYVRKPQYTKENYGKTTKSTNTTGSTVKGKIKQGIDSGVKKGKEVASQVKQSGKKFGDLLKAGNRQKNPKAVTGPQKAAQAVNQTLRKGRVLTKKYFRKNKPLRTAAGKVITGVKNNPGSVVRGAKNLTKGSLIGLGADAVIRRTTAPITNRVTKGIRNYIRKTEYGDKPLTLEESNALTKKVNNMSGAERKAYLKKQKERRKAYKQSKKTNTSNQSSTTKNINKQKTSNNNKLKVSNVSQRDKDLREAKRRVKKAKGYNKEKLQREVRYLEKFGKQGRTWSNPEGAKGNNKPSSVKTDTTSNTPKPGSARAKLRAKNEARFGKARVDKLRAKNKDFQAMKKKKMTKAEFIRRYPNSITAQKAKGLRK